MTTVLLCGDSYYDFDDRYPGLHWADNLSADVYRLARGGCSNFSIWHQVQYAPSFNPDLVLLSFTSIPRVEFLKKEMFAPIDLSKCETLADIQWAYRNTIYDNIDHALPGYNRDKITAWMPYYIKEYEILKNFIYIKSTLDFLLEHNIAYKFTLGAFEQYNKDFGIYALHNILPNGWDFPEKLMDPCFHIKNEEWHHQHAVLVNGLLND